MSKKTDRKRIKKKHVLNAFDLTPMGEMQGVYNADSCLSRGGQYVYSRGLSVVPSDRGRVSQNLAVRLIMRELSSRGTIKIQEGRRGKKGVPYRVYQEQGNGDLKLLLDIPPEHKHEFSGLEGFLKWIADLENVDPATYRNGGK